tara:strand:+ start:6192 stop:6530 length:339 start_codon:yes stop_codon:yes gene_type:complete
MTKRSGFTLIEAVIALTIAAMGMAGVYELYAGAARVERASTEITYAARLADGLLASGVTDEDGEDAGYAWRVVATPVAAIPGLRRVTVSVETPRGRTVEIVTEMADIPADPQ